VLKPALPPEVFPRRADLYAIGVTGNIATGKSTVDAMLAAKGAIVVDADAVVRDLERAGQPVLRQIVDRFGPHTLDARGELDRAGLARMVFGSPEALRDLELIVHPAVRAEVKRRIIEAPPRSVLAIDAVKLIESGMADACDTIWAVTAGEDQQIKRLAEQRSMSGQDALQRLRAQPDPEDKVRRADVVIDNSASLEALRRQVDDAWDRTAGAWLSGLRA